MGRFLRLAHRVEDTLTLVIDEEPQNIDPSELLVSENNRQGAPPNTRHVHLTILKGFKEKGYGRSRPMIGICVKVTSEEGRRRLILHNLRFTKGNPLLPPINEQKAMQGPLYATLAGTHFNLALRCLQIGLASPIGDLSKILEENKHLKLMVHGHKKGHKWWVLPEGVLKEKQLEISMWRNMDQHENQATHEVELLQCIKLAAEALAAAPGENKDKKKKLTMGDLVALTVRRSPAKVSTTALQALAKLYIGFLENSVVSLVEEIVDFHCQTVGPKEVTVSTSFVSVLVSEEPLNKCPYTRAYLLLTQYTNEKLRTQVGGPGVSQLIETSLVTSLCKKPDLLLTLETKFREIRAKYLPLLEKGMSPSQARIELQGYMDLVLRCLFSGASSAKPGPL